MLRAIEGHWDHIMLIDSHCHLDFDTFSDDFEDIFVRAHSAGVTRMLTICTRVREFDRIHRIALERPDVWCTVGTHPHNAGEETDVTGEDLQSAAARPRVVAIGECGLDYYYDYSPRDVQADVFRTHCRAARSIDMPIVVHSRDAEEDTAALLHEEGAGDGLRGVLHCFSSGPWLAEKALEMGFYISFSGIVTFKKSEELRTIARTVPMDRLLVETDAPYLAPIPKRGKRNEPAYTAFTARFLAEIKGISFEDFAAQTTANFHRLFDRVPAPIAEVA